MALEIYERLDIHQGMCADAVRNQAYRRALEAAVREQSVVLDVGTGTGLLARYAARAGARRVYAIEQSPIAEIARPLGATVWSASAGSTHRHRRGANS